MTKKQMQAAQNSIGAASNQFANMSRTKEPVFVDVPDDFDVALGQMN
jgi:hypothetical protein